MIINVMIMIMMIITAGIVGFKPIKKQSNDDHDDNNYGDNNHCF